MNHFKRTYTLVFSCFYLQNISNTNANTNTNADLGVCLLIQIPCFLCPGLQLRGAKEQVDQATHHLYDGAQHKHNQPFLSCSLQDIIQDGWTEC